MIAAVVVTHSAPEAMLGRCLRALTATPGVEQIVCVYNGGGAIPVVPPGVQVVATSNRGYGAAINEGVAATDPELPVFALNDDVVVLDGWLAPLVDALAPPDVGAAQPVHVAADHDVVVSCGVQVDPCGAGSDIGDGEAPPTDPGPSEIDVFTGGAVLFDRTFWRSTGGFDERWFLYYEDVDLARRGARSGWRYVLAHASRVEHRRSTTTSGDRSVSRYHQERNRLWAAFRWADAATIVRACWLSLRRLRHEPRRVHAKSLLAGLAGAPRLAAARWSDRPGLTEATRG